MGRYAENNLKKGERRAVIDELLEGSNSGKLAHGDSKRVAQQFGCSTKQVSAVWRQYKSQKDAGIAAPSLRSKRAEMKIQAGKVSTWKRCAKN